MDLKEVVTEPLEAPVEPDAPVAKDESRGELAAPGADTPATAELKEGEAADASPDDPAEPQATEPAQAQSVEEPAPPEEEAQPPLTLLKKEVLPGTAARLAWSPSVSFMGISSPTAVLVVNGVKPGPTLCLTAALHGDELNGIEVVRRVLYDLDPTELSGAVIGIPIVNVEGFRSASRYLADRRDLNRYFPGNPEGSAASRIAHSFFNEVITECDSLIDLHTGSFRRTNLPQLRADLAYRSVEELSRKMGSIVVLQSRGAKGSLRRAATERGIPAVTLEAGAPHELQKSAIEYGVKSVQSALSGLGISRPRAFKWRSDEPVFYKSRWARASEGGILISEVALGASIRKGELLGAVTDPITNRRSEIRSPADGRVIGMALNQVMHPGFAAYHIGIKASAVDAASDQPVGGTDDDDPDLEPTDDETDDPDAAALEINPGVSELGEESDA